MAAIAGRRIIIINLLGLIQMYNTYDHKEIYHNVAACILKNYNRLDTMNTAQIAELCNVSSSTLNRFYNMMDYPATVSRLPDIVSETKDSYIFEGNYIPLTGKDNDDSSIDLYLNILRERITSLQTYIKVEQIKKLVKDIRTCKKVIFLGCPIPQEVWRLQMDLTMCGIESSAFMNPNYQYEELEQLEKGSIVFYFQYLRLGDPKFKKAILEGRNKIKKLVVVTNNKAHPLAATADYLFYYPGNGTEQDSILMNICVNLIAMTFRENEL